MKQILLMIAVVGLVAESRGVEDSVIDEP